MKRGLFSQEVVFCTGKGNIHRQCSCCSFVIWPFPLSNKRNCLHHRENSEVSTSESFAKSGINEVCRLITGITKSEIIVMLLIIDNWTMSSSVSCTAIEADCLKLTRCVSISKKRCWAEVPEVMKDCTTLNLAYSRRNLRTIVWWPTNVDCSLNLLMIGDWQRQKRLQEQVLDVGR